MKQKEYSIYPLIPLRDLVVFPRMIIPLICRKDEVN